ncbi:MAG: hypothetical protein QOG73_4756, partial [Acetobacteraceae bacterium]|nr:hypothetical protein [Acetobacteraceae bacterium]
MMRGLRSVLAAGLVTGLLVTGLLAAPALAQEE